MTCLTDLCRTLQLAPVPEDWSERWPQSESSYTAGAVFFLQPAYMRQVCNALGMGADVAPLLGDAARSMAADPCLERLAWHCHWLLFRSGLETQAGRWPALPPEAHPAGPLFYAVVFLSGWPFAERVHRARGIAPDVTRATLSDLEVWIREHKRRYGTWGFREAVWLPHHFQGRLYTLGRLQYLLGRFHDPFRFYRHAVSGQVAALAEDGLEFRDDGQFASADGGAARASAWRSRFAADEEAFRGNPVSPRGVVLLREAVLRRPEWVEILRPGDPVMTVHIAATGPMDPAACGASFRQAVAFFAEHFPDWPYRAFTCGSWLLDPQLERLVPPPAHIAAFLREWYLHPVEGAGDAQALERVFNVLDGRAPEPDRLPQASSLQRAMAAGMRAGTRFRMGGSILFPEDLDWGRQVYRAWTPEAAGGR
jgi:hypothetical protein